MIGMEWSIYAVALSAIVAGGAWIVERILAGSTAPTRWIWAVALGLALVLPLRGVQPESALAPAVGPVMVSPAPVDEAGSVVGWSLLDSLDRWLELVARPSTEAVDRLVAAIPVGRPIGSLFIALWLAGSAATLALFTTAHLRVRHQASAWPRRTVAGEAVRVSSSFGPATIGIRRPVIVLPAWVLSLSESHRRMIVRHEAAHVAGGDTRLLATALLPVVAMPWNPAVWWMLRRLRDAIELDCDRRALGREGAAVPYGRLLVELGHRPAASPMLVAPAIVGHPSLLERRIVALKRLRATGPGRAAIAAATAVCILVLAVACGMDVPAAEDATGPTVGSIPGPEAAPEPSPEPMEPPDPEPEPEPDAAVPDNPRIAVEVPNSGTVPLDGPGVGPVPGSSTGDDISAQPTFTPYTVAPEIRNRAVVAEALQREYPDVLRDAGIGGRVLMYFFVNENGNLDNVQVAESSGLPQLDEAALRVARAFEFEPAQNRGQPTAVWIMVPVTFESR